MKLRRIARFHGLKRPRVRQTWNKYNLYNLSRLREPFTSNRTFFQQKWVAKALTRGYHGEHIKERKWERMFSRRLISAVDMDPAYLATNDGSELASGRGSGRQTRQSARALAEKNLKKPAITPYMQMIYAPMERRLDQAVFRALFASSARQARQFCVHGAVKVNGVKMKYPGYLLNPGDMFQVDVEKVMFATGRKKDPTVKLAKSAQKSSEEAAEGEGEDAEAASSEPAEQEAAAEELDEAAQKKKRVQSLKTLRLRAKNIIKTGELSAKKKQAVRSLMKDVKATWGKIAGPGGTSPSKLQEADEIVDQLSKLLAELQVDSPSKTTTTNQTLVQGASKDSSSSDGPQTKEEREILKRLIQEEIENPVDPSKPYATPWQPRPYMSPFAFIPRYLEVNQKICAAVYLRHPVARQGLAEVPTPFPSGVNQLAFNWYLRRG